MNRPAWEDDKTVAEDLKNLEDGIQEGDGLRTMSSEQNGLDGTGISRQEARAREEDFISRLILKASETGAILNPVTSKECVIRKEEDSERWDSKRVVKDLMLKLDVLDRSLVKAMPLNQGVRIDAGSSGLFSGFKAQVSVVGQCLSPIEDFLKSDVSARKTPFSEVDRAVKAILDAKRDHHYVGIFSTTGFAGECLGNIPAGKGFSCALLEKGAGSEWTIHGGGSAEWRGAAGMFDFETRPEKVMRCAAALKSHPDLRLRGGHVQIERAKTELGFPADVFEEALAQIAGLSGEFVVRQFDGVKILQKSRF